MSRSIPSLVKPSLLVWARETAGLSLAQAAQRSKFDLERLATWERGEESPSIAQVRKLGEVYKRPLAVFFLSEPPKGFSAQKEFRRLAGIIPGKESPELLLALRSAVFRREAAMELYQVTGETPPTLGAELHPKMDREEGGRVIRDLLGITWAVQLGWNNPHEALNGWRGAIEAKGALVFQNSKVPLDEMRATCIPDQPLPVILLNSKDAPHARIFSLLHEFAHILLHAGGHKTSRMDGTRSPEEVPLEVAANAFAATALLPRTEFLEVSDRYSGAVSGEDESLRLLAQRVKVSPEVILRRLTSLRRTSESLYARKREEWGKRVWYVRDSGQIVVTPEVRVVSANGRGFSRLVLEAYDRRLISTSAASDYLNAKPTYFSKIRSHTFTRGNTL
jgi:Zn-dependent peptidase ImmA (M78 family)/transcriptional regulator with XRE-family HTH domain